MTLAPFRLANSADRIIEDAGPLSVQIAAAVPQGAVPPASPTTSENGHTDQPTDNPEFCGPYEKILRATAAEWKPYGGLPVPVQELTGAIVWQGCRLVAVPKSVLVIP